MLVYCAIRMEKKKKKTITYSDAQDGRLEAGSAFLSAALPLWGWERYSTTLALETVKMVLLSPHRVTLHQRKMFYLLLQKSPQLHQVTNLWLMSHFMCNYIAHVFVPYSPSCKRKRQEIVLGSWDVVENAVSQKKLSVVYSSDLIYVLSQGQLRRG